MAKRKKKAAGVKAAAAIANNNRPINLEGDGEQLEMLEALGLPVNSNVLALRAKRVGPGRPAGSRNKRTVEMANYLLSNTNRRWRY
jgi:hypothetical protein